MNPHRAAGRLSAPSLADVADDAPDLARKTAEEQMLHLLAGLREDLAEAEQRRQALDRAPAHTRAERAQRLAEGLEAVVRAAELTRVRGAAVGAVLSAEMAGEVEGLLARLRAMAEGMRGPG